ELLEVKHRLQFKLARCRRRSVRSARDRVGLPKDWRAQVSDQRSVIDIVEDVAGVHAEREVVTVARRAAQAHRSARRSAESASPWATSAGPAPSTAGAVLTAHSRGPLGFRSKSDGLA